MTTQTELHTIIPATVSRGIPIPAPKDPNDTARWHAAVAVRKTTGRGMQVGDA